MRAVVFGSTGMAGRAVVAALRLAGCVVAAPTRRDDGLHAERPVDLRPFLRGAELAVNCVALLRSDPVYGMEEYRRSAVLVNALWPHVVIAQAREVGCRVVQISTDAVFSPAESPASERDPADANEAYGMSKALGELEDDQALNLRLSVIGPAPDRRPGLWEWLVRQPPKAVVPGYATFPWTGCTSEQVGRLIADLLPSEAFDAVRAMGPTHHFVPNGPATKFDVLTCLAKRLRPDVTVQPSTEQTRSSRPLASLRGALETVYTGRRGWTSAIEVAGTGS